MSVVHANRFISERQRKPLPPVVAVDDLDGGGLVVNLDEIRVLKLIWMDSEAATEDRITALFHLDDRQEELCLRKSARGGCERMLRAATAHRPFVVLAEEDRVLVFRCADVASARVSRPFIAPTRDRRQPVCTLRIHWADGAEFDCDIPADRAGEVAADFEAALKRIPVAAHEPFSFA